MSAGALAFGSAIFAPKRYGVGTGLHCAGWDVVAGCESVNVVAPIFVRHMISLVTCLLRSWSTRSPQTSRTYRRATQEALSKS